MKSRNLLLLTMVVTLALAGSSAFAISPFKKVFDEKYVKESGDEEFQASFRKAGCYTCHVREQKRDFVNAFGWELAQLIEGMLIRGLNDSDAALMDLAAIVRRIRPDEVHINLPVRPPAVASVEVPDDESILRARAILGDVAHVVHHSDVEVDLAGCDDLASAIRDLVQRHPMTGDELSAALNLEPSEVADALNGLHARGSVREVVRHGRRFWASAESQYTNQAPAAPPIHANSTTRELPDST